MEKLHVITDTINKSYRLAYFPQSKRFFKVNDKAIALINNILEDKAEEDICKNFNINEEELELYRRKVNECNKAISCPRCGSEVNDDKVLGRLVIHLANGCNLRCVYCYANGGTYHSSAAMLTKNMVDRIIDKFYSRYNRIEGLQLFGGEPLLNMDVMEYACERFKEKDPDINIGIVTNGTLIDTKFIELAKKYQIHTTISYDGDFDVNNRLRVHENGNGTSEMVLTNAKRFKEETNLLDTIEATYTQYHQDSGVSVLAVIKHINEVLPDVPIHLVPAGGSEECEYILNDYKPFVDSIDDIFKENLLNDKNDYTYSLMQRIIFGIVNRTPGSSYICDAGVSTLSVSVNGDVYPCFMFTDMERYKLGNIEDDNLFFDDKFLSTLRELRSFSNKDENEECKNCYIKNICNGCLGLNAMNEDTDKYVMDIKSCDMSRRMTDRVLVHLAELQKQERTD